MERDGNGWVECSLGHRHWGRFGAAGLLLFSLDDSGQAVVLLQHRAEWTHEGGTWGIPGGARDSHETAAQAALREAQEEAALDPAQVTVADVSREDHGTWAYETVLGFASEPLATHPNDESVALEWTAMRDVALRDLHPGFARSWPMLAALARGLRAPWGRLHPPDSSAEYTSSPET